ncbi:carbon storage regulator [Stratiformator vulcanicus]|uniref:Translational regulator CsrA n=1 Tax=Stratiformator vulcanicus TaxID=2527980 RepID=A0A517QYN9_9PLAN|nr:carbon storage regulator [Stratiformator vulcanicus]QDT36766.1 hypothetical protein Pan189_11290 [Stratiformator vulcanicus]
MLVLNRKSGEQIVIGHGITVSVVRTSGGRVTLAIDAPEDIPIRRGELIASGEPFSHPSFRSTAAAT